MKKLFILSAFLLTVMYVYSQEPGTLDASFAGKGWTSLEFGKGNRLWEKGRQVLIQKDGSYLILFETDNYSLLTRYLPNGTLDSSFGTYGFSEAVSIWNAHAAIQSDGKIVIAGITNGAGTDYNDFGLARYNADGSLDSTFDGDGKLTTDFFGFTDQAISIAIQKNRKIIVVGVAYDQNDYTSDFAIARYNEDGTLDSTFDGDGKLTTDFLDGYDFPECMALQNDDKIVVAGSIENKITYQSQLILVRYNPNGSIDSTFGKDGNLITGSSFNSIIIQKDGKIILAGQYSNSVYISPILFRYNSDGTPDSSFDGDGQATTNVEGSASSVALQSDGKIVVGATTHIPNSQTYNTVLIRFNADGSMDGSFGRNGRVITKLEANEYYPAIAIAIQSNDEIIAAGTISNDFALVRYTKNGLSDRSFDADGLLIGYYPVTACTLNHVLVQKDGKIVVAGIADSLFLARYNSDGTLDSSFDVDGKVIINLIGSANFITIQQNGKIVVASLSSDHFSIIRYNTDGSLDSTLDGNGMLTGYYPKGQYEIHCIAVQSNGKVLLAGNHFDDFTQSYVIDLMRYNADGSIDSTFDKDGIATTSIGEFANEAVSLAIQRNGKTIVLGRVGGYGAPPYDVGLARFNEDGSLDSTFSGDGKLRKGFFGSNDGNAISSLALQPDGKILVAGTDNNISTTIIAYGLIRFNEDGSLDSSFNEDGQVATSFDGYAHTIATQNDGKIIIAGSAGVDFGIIRYNQHGYLDSTFNEDGKLTTDFGGYDAAGATAISQNKLYVVGSSTLLGTKGILAAYHLDCTKHVYYKDADQDGYGNRANKVLACTAPVGFVKDSTDCNDSSAAVHPGAAEICGNGIDDNCNGQVDENCPTTPFLTINDTAVYESAGVAILTVRLSHKVDHSVYVPYFTIDGTARSFTWFNKDYKASWGVVMIPAGAQTATIPITIYDEGISEPDEYFDVYIFNALCLETGYQKGRITIKDGAPVLAPSITQIQENQQSSGTLQVKAYPNPSTSSFTFVLQSASNAPVGLHITDAIGRTVENKTGMTANTSLQLGSNYAPGIYYIEATQGKQKVTLKLIKQSP